MVQQGKATFVPGLAGVLYTATGAHGLTVGQFVTYIGDTNGRFNGWYKVIAVPTANTALLANLSSPTSGQPFNTVLAASGGGTMLVNQVQQNVRAEDISWQGAAAGATLSLLDRNGQLIWTALSTLAESSSQNRGKIMWVDGITLQTISSGTVLVTIN
jgi:outer membrane protein assembly factor BamB